MRVCLGGGRTKDKGQTKKGKGLMGIDNKVVIFGGRGITGMNGNGMNNEIKKRYNKT